MRRLPLLKLPELNEWNTTFRPKGSLLSPRATLANVKTAQMALKKLKIANPRDVTAVELYPGLGAWTSGMVQAGFKRIITVENNAKYAKWMSDMAKESKGVIELLKKDGYDWDTYLELKKPNYIGDIADTDWSRVHPHLFFTGTLPRSSRGEQLLAQFASCISNRMAMHSNGRIQMAMWMPEQLYQKFTAPPGSMARCKMSIVIEACASVECVYVTEPSGMFPNMPYYLVNVLPNEKRRITAQWDVFEYVLKHLFVMQRQPLAKMIK
ncbi:ribosomal RNA adenine methyltransferase KsgA/Erm [Zychaea mexicana]|uniref:ribosomal RNA adenine methyltransferase KsgA/Erm n=1 Tax=Zychaea mexicana TaxID=64656 RepID=UPI0022FE71AB|nr:ribosomal RNA adenine methyltransferase KsgA/Erm [Zychaea mexicana]KAI9489465.1 ribosomal RNA adenine methyltransferase KsgA/Erm [Zychaea mexicana]